MKDSLVWLREKIEKRPKLKEYISWKDRQRKEDDTDDSN